MLRAAFARFILTSGNLHLERMDIIAAETLLDINAPPDQRAAARSAIAKAHVIIAVDSATQNEFTVYGTPALEETVRVGKEMALRSIRIVLTDRAGQLDRLVPLVRAIKAGQEYQPE